MDDRHKMRASDADRQEVIERLRAVGVTQIRRGGQPRPQHPPPSQT